MAVAEVGIAVAVVSDWERLGEGLPWQSAALSLLGQLVHHAFQL